MQDKRNVASFLRQCITLKKYNSTSDAFEDSPLKVLPLHVIEQIFAPHIADIPESQVYYFLPHSHSGFLKGVDYIMEDMRELDKYRFKKDPLNDRISEKEKFLLGFAALTAFAACITYQAFRALLSVDQLTYEESSTSVMKFTGGFLITALFMGGYYVDYREKLERYSNEEPYSEKAHANEEIDLNGEIDLHLD